VRYCPECGYPREAHAKIEGAPRQGPPPHSGGRPAGAPPVRVCALVSAQDPGATYPLLRADRDAYRSRIAARDMLREEFRDDEPEPYGPSYKVVRGPRPGSGPRGRLRPGEAPAAA